MRHPHTTFRSTPYSSIPKVLRIHSLFSTMIRTKSLSPGENEWWDAFKPVRWYSRQRSGDTGANQFKYPHTSCENFPASPWTARDSCTYHSSNDILWSTRLLFVLGVHGSHRFLQSSRPCSLAITPHNRWCPVLQSILASVLSQDIALTAYGIPQAQWNENKTRICH